MKSSIFHLQLFNRRWRQTTCVLHFVIGRVEGFPALRLPVLILILMVVASLMPVIVGWQGQIFVGRFVQPFCWQVSEEIRKEHRFKFAARVIIRAVSNGARGWCNQVQK